ncbi:MAG: response regulator [Fusobacteriaceae bacterium]
MLNKILIIDDSDDICFAISEFFEFKGWETKTACDVETALDILKDIKFNIILIDYHMPNINGALGVKLIRHYEKDAPIIAMTVENDENIADSFFLAGASDFAIKPIKMIDLYSRINVHLNNSNKLANSLNTINTVNTVKVQKESTPCPKGIDKNTLHLIEKELKSSSDYLDVEDIANKTGIAAKTINRYMNFLVSSNIVSSDTIYGKVGRPKKIYKWENI